MAANEINMKQISEDLKSFLTKEMENNAKKITEKILEEINTKFDKLRTQAKTQAEESLAKKTTVTSVTLQVSQLLFKKN